MTAPSSSPAPISRKTAELCAVSDIGDAVQPLLTDGEPAQRAFVKILCGNEMYAEAVRFVAHALPARESIWWAWVCARKSAGAEPAPAIKAALEATERWIMQPTEAHRRQALECGEKADFGTPAGCVALAAFMSSGSLGPADAPPVPPSEFMTAKAVAGSITLSAVLTEPERAKEKFEEFLEIGLEVAGRTGLWPTTGGS